MEVVVRTPAPQAAAVPALPTHPLDPLTTHEVARAGQMCKAYADKARMGAIRFNSIALQEPKKDELLAFKRGFGPCPARQAMCVLILPKQNKAAEVIVHLDTTGDARKDRLILWRELDGVHPMTTPEDNFYAEEIMRKDARVQQLVKERYGVTDLSTLICDTWACHGAPEHLNHRRLMQGFLYLKLFPGDNEYAHPLDMVPIVDLNEGKVVHIDMYDRPPPVPMQSVNYRDGLLEAPYRTDIKPLDVVQPEGPSFTVEGNLIKWQKWEVRIGFNPREGLVLHDVAYRDGGRSRPVLHRASLVEMAVPYGDPNYPYIRKCAFDVGDYGFGFCANSLQLGCDCLGHIRYFDAVLNTSSGEPLLVRKAVCLHEEDAGVMWKHWDCRDNHSEVRRSRRLVISMVSTFMNYEYCLYWYFYQDGTISFELKLTGILSTSVAPVDEDQPRFGVRVAEGVNATAHQHFFCMRIDPSVDDEMGGRDLLVTEVEARPLPVGAQNPFGNAFIVHEQELTSTDTAQREANFATARHWRIKNPFSINPVSKRPVAFRLLPSGNPALMCDPSSLVYQRAKFATKQLFVTPYADDQKYPSGEHVVQSKTCMGLGQWLKKDQPLIGKDPVLWYSFGVTHIPRVEDFPVMPVEIVGFSLKPEGFFTGNPAVDIPKERNFASKEDVTGKEQAGAMAMACCSASTTATAATATSITSMPACGVPPAADVMFKSRL